MFSRLKMFSNNFRKKLNKHVEIYRSKQQPTILINRSWLGNSCRTIFSFVYFLKLFVIKRSLNKLQISGMFK